MKTQLLFAALAVVLIAGCNRESSTTGGTTTASGSKSLKIVYIPKNTGNPYFDEVDRGFKDAAKELGADYTTIGPATADSTSQLPIIKDQIQRGVDIIAISVNSEDALDTTLEQARAKGIIVVTVDSDLKDPRHRDAAVLPADFNDIGPGQVELLGKLTDYQGDFAILSATSNAPNQNAWIEKMKETLKDPKYSKMKLVEIVYGNDDAAKSTTECEALLAKYPNLSGIISPTSVGLAAAAPVIQRAGVYPGGAKAVGKGLQLTGLSTPAQLKKFVDQGIVNGFQLWEPYKEGYVAACIGQQIKEGKVKPAADTEVEIPTLGKRKFSAKTELIGGDLITFDKSNIDKYKF
ncbi:rhamnose ABC transporter substrate-binding protein [soil metagenome]